MDILVEVLEQNEGRMTFDAFKAAVRSAGGNPVNWLKAKHKGLLTTEIGEDGVLYVSLPEGEAV